MSFNYSPKIVNDSSLVLCLDAANSKSYVSGSTAWNDISRRGNNGTLTNGPMFTTSGSGAIVFDGIDDYVNINTPTTGDTTYAIWFKISSNNDNRRLFDASTSSFRNFSIGYAGSGTNNVLGGYDGTNQPLTTSILSIGIWYYAVAVMQTNNYKIYINGINQALVWNLGTTGNWVNNTVNVNAIASTSAASFFNGNISLVQIYSRALTQSEITQNFNAHKSRYGL